MNIYIALVVVSAVYAGAMAIFVRHAPRSHAKRSPLWGIDTSTKAGRKKYIETCGRLAREAREHLKDGIE